MAKTSLMLLVVLCGLVSLGLADPTMYGAAPAKYPSAPVPYPVHKYETPATPAPPANKYETPTTTYLPPNKYETPTTTTTVKYETPKYEKKMEQYPGTMKMKYGTAPPPAKRYRRAADVEKEAADVEEEKTADQAAKVAAAKKTSQPAVGATKLSAKNVKLLRDAVIESLLSDPVCLCRERLEPGRFGGNGVYRPGPGVSPRPSKYFDDEDDGQFF